MMRHRVIVGGGMERSRGSGYRGVGGAGSGSKWGCKTVSSSSFGSRSRCRSSSAVSGTCSAFVFFALYLVCSK